MTELTEGDIVELHRIIEAFRAIEAKFPVTALTSPTEGHVHNRIIAEIDSGTPTHTAPEGTMYWDKAANILYANSDGGTTWTSVGGTGFAGNHTLDDAVHTDVAGMAEARGDLIVRTFLGSWDRLPLGASGTYLRSNGSDPRYLALQDADLPTHGNDRHDEANWVNYVPMGSDQLGTVLT